MPHLLDVGMHIYALNLLNLHNWQSSSHQGHSDTVSVMPARKPGPACKHTRWTRSAQRNTPVRPFPALQCTTTVLRASAARYAAASVQKLCRSARGGACHKHGAGFALVFSCWYIFR